MGATVATTLVLIRLAIGNDNNLRLGCGRVHAHSRVPGARPNHPVNQGVRAAKRGRTGNLPYGGDVMLSGKSVRL